jgi:RES domain-containing protein
VSRHLRARALSTEGSERYGGRYNPKGVFGALYLGESPAVCAAELRKAAAGRTIGSLVLATVAIRLHRVFDLTDRGVLERLALPTEDLVTPDWSFTQELGRLTREVGFEALRVPSAAGPGSNLVLFLDRLDRASSVLLIAIEPTQL